MRTSTILFLIIIWNVFLLNHKIKVQNILIKIEENGNSVELSQHEWPWSREIWPVLKEIVV